MKGIEYSEEPGLGKSALLGPGKEAVGDFSRRHVPYCPDALAVVGQRQSSVFESDAGKIYTRTESWPYGRCAHDVH